MTANRTLIWSVMALLAVFLFGRTFFFVVDQRESAIVLRFGQFERLIAAPGLQLKWPWEQVLSFDKRNQALDADKEEVIAADQERLAEDYLAQITKRPSGAHPTNAPPSMSPPPMPAGGGE